MLHDNFSSGYLSDQAEGLRRLLTQSAAQVVTVVGARSGLGATSVVVNLASLWAEAGHRVLILDEHLSEHNVANSLALKSRYDLLNVVRGDKTAQDVTLRIGNGVQLLPVARAMQSLTKLDESERAQLLAALTHAARNIDIVLVDAAAREGHSVCSNLSGTEPVLLVLNSSSSGITESYAMLKQMVLHKGHQSFNILVNKVNDAQEARAIFDNMATLAWRNLQVRLEYMGYIPTDGMLKRATQLCAPVVELFSEARSSVAISQLAGNLIQHTNTAHEKNTGLTTIMQRLVRQNRHTNMLSAVT